jgi:hypothetical protein
MAIPRHSRCAFDADFAPKPFIGQTFIEAASSAALLTFHRSHHPSLAETTGSRRRTAISGANEIRQHVFHESSEDRILIVQGSAIANRAPIKDPATVEALPVNHLRL